ncbi:hypothetical protein [Sodalis sp.]
MLVISGESGWCSQQAAALCDVPAGDWLLVVSKVNAVSAAARRH